MLASIGGDQPDLAVMGERGRKERVWGKRVEGGRERPRERGEGARETEMVL